MDATKHPMLEAAKALSPKIRSCADQIEAERELPPALFDELADAGLFKLGLPRSLGGAEIDLPSYIEVLGELGEADASTAWVVNQCAIFATYAARMPHEIAREIWTDTPRCVVANTSFPTSEAVPVPGGYRVTGRHRFSSGCRHASWFAARAWIPEDGEPVQKFLFVPAAEVEVLDTWKVRGMRGTGTHDFAVDGAFVPAQRTIRQRGAPVVEPGPLYGLSIVLLFACGDAALALGAARSCLDAFMELAGAKTPHAMQAMLRDQPAVQVAVGQTVAALASGRAYLRDAVRALWAEAVSEAPLTLDRRVALRLATTHCIRAAVQAVETLYNGSGTTAIFEGNVIQRHFQDLHVISQHQQARQAAYELAGKHTLGLEIETTRL
ncbi:MAG: acyl-CoA dehydrogenase family protein [Deltaproteobacteria bacterium]|nr:acyl-CoA dehydrogenase family protein [Deltaproteobacteria bacterium]